MCPQIVVDQECNFKRSVLRVIFAYDSVILFKMNKL